MPTRLITRDHHTAGPGWMSVLAGLFAAARPGRLDPRSLSDHLKRDLGFLDGNSARSKGR